MAHEGPPSGYDYYSQFPEGYPSAGLFNVDAMTDGQIASMGTAFDREFYRGDDAPVGPTEGLDALLEHLGSDLAQLAIYNPERGMSLLMRLAQSDDASERRVALAACPPLGRLDYEAGCGVLLEAQAKIKEVRGDYDDIVGAKRLMTRLLPPDLAADLDQRAYERWPDGE